MFACDKKAPEKAPKKPLADLFVGKQPTIPSVFKNVTFGMLGLEAEEILGERATGSGFRNLEYEGITNFALALDRQRVKAFTFTVPAGKGLAALEKSWGKPVVGQDQMTKSKLYLWRNPKKGLRLVAREGEYEIRLSFEQYYPLESLLAGSGTRFGFEAKTPIIGADGYALEKNLGDAYTVTDPHGGIGTLELPPTDFAGLPTTVNISHERGKVWRMFIYIDFDEYPDKKTVLLEQLASKFGGLDKQPVKALDSFDTATSPQVRVTMNDSGTRYRIAVIAKSPAAESPKAKSGSPAPSGATTPEAKPDAPKGEAVKQDEAKPASKKDEAKPEAK